VGGEIFGTRSDQD